MTSVVDLAKLANAVYNDVTSVGLWLRRGLPFTTQGSGFKSALYQNRQTADFALVVAGTSPTELDDLHSDVQLALGRMPNQYRVARSAFADAMNQTGGLVGFYLTGHSLGGGLVSMLGKEHGNPTVTFNAPGMARAFSNLESREPGMGSVRDEDRKVLHICAYFDVVSRGTGAHLGGAGTVVRHYTGSVGRNTAIGAVVGTVLSGGNPLVGAAAAGGATALTAHSMDRMVSTLDGISRYHEPLDWL
jgi:hypothetical protein